jgi:hypothetical protein
MAPYLQLPLGTPAVLFIPVLLGIGDISSASSQSPLTLANVMILKEWGEERTYRINAQLPKSQTVNSMLLYLTIKPILPAPLVISFCPPFPSL